MLVLQSRDLLGLVLDRVSLSELPACGRVSRAFRSAALKVLVRRFEAAAAHAPARVEAYVGTGEHEYRSCIWGYSHRAGTIAGLWTSAQLVDQMFQCFEPDLTRSAIEAGETVCRFRHCCCTSAACAKFAADFQDTWNSRPPPSCEVVNVWCAVVDFVFFDHKSLSLPADTQRTAFDRNSKSAAHSKEYCTDAVLSAVILDLVPAPYYFSGTQYGQFIGHCVRVDGYCFSFGEYWIAQE